MTCIANGMNSEFKEYEVDWCHDGTWTEAEASNGTVLRYHDARKGHRRIQHEMFLHH
jgi:hypothetical protein